MSEERFVMLPSIVVDQIEYERGLARAREQRRKKRNHHGPRMKNRDRPFVAWDGEGPRDAGYALFGSSMGDEICHPFLGTQECLDLILQREIETPEAIHIWFGSNYDVSMILRELTWRHFSALKHFNQTIWRDYLIEHIPGKWFQVSSRGITAKIFDIYPFLGSAYVPTLIKMNIGTDAELAHLKSEKARRSEFLWSEIDEIREYFRLELKLMPELAEKYRQTFLDAGFDLRSWHGPGALAHMAMRRHGVYTAMAKTPFDVSDAARFAFAGGRFEMFRGGHIQETIYNADIHSAYPFFATRLPNLARGTWRRGRYYEAGKFAVYHIRYHDKADPLRPYPLFQRLGNGEVVWPNTCEGWYWSPEAELVCDDDHAEFLEAWIFDEDSRRDRPFAWLEEYYQRRAYLKGIGSPLELTFKLIINSVYGQLAQRTGWDRKKRSAPHSHQLEWAGYITSACRAAVYRAAMSCGSAVVSIDTDGIYATRKPTVDRGDKLGQWEIDTFDSGIFWQSGIYALGSDDCRHKELGIKCYNYGGPSSECDHYWVKGRTRGVPKGKYTADMMIDALKNDQPLRLVRKTFVGYGLALNGQRDKLNTWEVNEDDPIEIVFGGQGKRYHNSKFWCGKKGCHDGIHDFIQRPTRFKPGETTQSEAHYLPWMAPNHFVEQKKRNLLDTVIYDANSLDEDDEWVKFYVPKEA